MSRSVFTLTLSIALGLCAYATPFVQAEEKGAMDKANEATTGAYGATKEGTNKAWEATKEGTRELNVKVQGE